MKAGHGPWHASGNVTDEDEKAELARQGMRAAELIEPGKLGEAVKESVAEGAGTMALRTVAALGRLRGKARSPARARAAAAVDISFRDFDAHDAASFEQRVRQAAAQKAEEEDESRRMDLSVLRRSFPEESRELALLIFNCVDLLEDLSDDAEGDPPSLAELEKKEQLLRRIAALLAPRSAEALTSFVEHVVKISRVYRQG